MSSFINRDIAKITLNKEIYYVCLYVHGKVLVNLSFFKKDGTELQELFTHNLAEDIRKVLIQKVRSNDVEKVTLLEYKEFNELLNQKIFATRKQMKDFINLTSNDLKAEYIGEIAGMNYIITTTKNIPFKQVYYLQETATGDQFEVGKVPQPFLEMILLDYVHHYKIEKEPTYISIDEGQFVGLKKNHKTASYIYVVNIKVSEDSVSASKAYVISKKNNYEFELLPLEQSNENIIESLKVEAQNMIHCLIKDLNMDII